jgi:hypothetical protein
MLAIKSTVHWLRATAMPSVVAVAVTTGGGEWRGSGWHAKRQPVQVGRLGTLDPWKPVSCGASAATCGHVQYYLCRNCAAHTHVTSAWDITLLPSCRNRPDHHVCRPVLIWGFGGGSDVRSHVAAALLRYGSAGLEPTCMALVLVIIACSSDAPA